ncbi:MAG: hypothetical protein RLZ04_1067 [Actinomycetota bacterium]
MSLPMPPEPESASANASDDPTLGRAGAPTDGPDGSPDSEPADILDIAAERRVPRAGELTPAWTAVFCLGWFGILCGFAAIWTSSRTTGFPTWWLGPESEPRLLLVNLIPFVAPLVLVVEGLVHRRLLPLWGIVGAAVCAVVAAFDLSGQPRYAAVEFLLAGAGLAVSVASFAGMLRRAG